MNGSECQDDSYLFMVVAKKIDGHLDSYAVWTCWNETTKSLNHGHYDLISLEECKNVVERFYR